MSAFNSLKLVFFMNKSFRAYKDFESFMDLYTESVFSFLNEF